MTASKIFLVIWEMPLNPNIKVLALRDIFKMELEQDYADKVNFDYRETTIAKAFSWEKSDLGQKFWSNINEFIKNDRPDSIITLIRRFLYGTKSK